MLPPTMLSETRWPVDTDFGYNVVGIMSRKFMEVIKIIII